MNGLPSSRLVQLFALRASGVPIFNLSEIYGRDRHNIRIVLTTHHIPMLSMDLRRKKQKSSTVRRVYFMDEPICQGKTYEEYLIDQRDRAWKKRLQVRM